MSSETPVPQTPTQTTPEAAVDEPANVDKERVFGDAGRRTSGDVNLLVIEAELVHEGKDVPNAARPATPEVTNELMARLERHEDDLRPAWAVGDDE